MTVALGRCLLAAALALAAGPADAATTRDLTLFTVAVRGTGETFVVATDSPELIRRCRSQLALPVDSRTQFPIGRLVAGHGGFNDPWTWHLDPDDWDLTEISIELCDGRPSFVEDELEAWLAQVGSYCPWSGVLVREGVAGPRADPSRLTVELRPALGGLARPVAGAALADGSGRRLVVEKAGRIRVVEGQTVRPTPFLDITDRVRSSANEQGLLGLALHPAFPGDGRLFVNYTDLAGDTVVSSFAATVDGADPESEVVLIEVEQPFSNHNGGHLAFAPDGTLFVGLGDGGSAGDPGDRAQDPSELLGKMLRLAVDGATSIPADNPFVDDPAVRDEIWALGLRNPWRFAFDRATGDLYIADVGQSSWEEVDVEGARSPGGVNWGWNRLEGSHCFVDPDCDPGGLTAPVAEYPHDEGCSITGGVVYRGRRFPFLAGVYLFSDLCSGRIWALAPGGPSGWSVAEVGHTTATVVAFAEDEDGEVWALDLAGTLLELEASHRPPAPRRPGGRRP